MTASSTPCSCNQIRKRCNSLGIVTNRPPRRFLFRRTCIDHHYHPNFLVDINSRDLHRFLLAWKRQNAREIGYTPSLTTTLPTRRDGATQIGSKRAFPIKLTNGLTSSRV